MLRGTDAVQDKVSSAFFEPVIRLGVTGLARAGKTVFITSLVANLLQRGRMHNLLAQSEQRIEAAFLQPQPDDTVPRFDYEAHLDALTAAKPHWPESTRQISELRLSLRVRPSGLLAGLQGARVVHLDIVDYPGEWLLDLGLLEQSYAAWSEAVLARIEKRPQAAAFRALLTQIDPEARLQEPEAQQLAQTFTAYLQAAREDGFYDCTPGRFLLPGDLAGSPVLTFAPLPPGAAPRRSLAREMARRFEAYKAQVVKPFFRAHFSRLDRQIVLIDVLGALQSGPAALEDLRGAMTEILAAFRPGRNAFLRRLLAGRRVERLLFAATKADQLHHTQHDQLAALMTALTQSAQDRARLAGAQTQAMALAALRATTEAELDHDGAPLEVVKGILEETGKPAAFHPGALPLDPGLLLAPARAGAAQWQDERYRAASFLPAPLTLRPGFGPPHIRLDQAAQYLFGDRL